MIFKFVLAVNLSLIPIPGSAIELKPVWCCLILIGILYFGNRLNVIVILHVCVRIIVYRIDIIYHIDGIYCGIYRL